MAVILLWGCRIAVGDFIYVDDDAPPGGDGSSWGTAYKYLQDALADAGVDVIWVAEGTYKPDEDEGGNVTPGDRNATFELQDSVSVYGGYAGYGAPDPNARDVQLYETILSGDLDGNDVEVNDPCDLLTEPTRGENSFHVVTGSGTDESAVLDGFTIMGGNANDQVGIHFLGGGMYNWGGRPTVVNCTFIGNSSDFDGGGMFNEAEGGFGPTLINCTFISNSAGGGGGGVLNSEVSSLTLTNCTFSGNWAKYDGGGMCNLVGAPELFNCTFAENTADIVGGGINNEDSDATLANCILWGNSAIDGNEIALHASSTIDVNYCDVKGGEADIYNDGTSTVNWGIGNIDADPCFVDPCNGDYHLQSQAGRWDPCTESWVIDANTSWAIDAGNPGCPLVDEPVDGNNVRINMGAYGGTAEASKTPADWYRIADLTNDFIVDLSDLGAFVGYWLESGQCIPSDLNRNGSVDFIDFAVFTQQPSQSSNTPVAEPSITYEITPCDLGLLAAEQSGQTRFTVTVEGSYIHFEDMMVANCCPDELWLEMIVEDNLITIYEIEHTTMPCYCICDYPVTATIGPFEPGTYTLEVYEDWGGFIGSTIVIID